MQDRRTLAAVSTAVLLALSLAACSASTGDRAGGDAGATVRVLTLASINDGVPPELAAWAAEVHRRSEGTLEIDVQQGWRAGDPSAEAGLVADVVAGKADLAWVGSRALDRVGVIRFQPLVAPFLIDSQALQAAVFSAGIADRMVAGVDSPDLIGLGVLPGPMRKVLGVAKPFLRPGDFAGQVVGMQDGDVAAQTLAALGAIPRAVPGGAGLAGLGGYEQQLASIWGNHYELTAGYVTGNLDLWPRPLVLFGAQRVVASLTSEQQEALRGAATASLPATSSAARAEDADAVGTLCASGMAMPVASGPDLEALRAAVQPVYDRLDTDPRNRDVIAQIAALKEGLAAPPDVAGCSNARAESPTSSGTPSSADSPPEGTYQLTLTDAEARRCPGHERDVGGSLELELRNGSVHQYGQRPGHAREIGWAGTYRAFRDRFELTEGTGAVMSALWRFDGGALQLSDLQHGECEDAVVWTTHPWVLQLPTSGGGAPPAGSYRTTITAADWAAKGLTGSVGEYTLTVAADTATLTEPDGSLGFTDPVMLFRDRVEIVIGTDTVTATWTATGNRLQLADVGSGDCADCGPYAVVLGSHPWQKTG